MHERKLVWLELSEGWEMGEAGEQRPYPKALGSRLRIRILLGNPVSL